jgi:hypothetical protein
MKITSYLLSCILFISIIGCGKKLFICNCFGSSNGLSNIAIFDKNNNSIYVDRVELFKYYDQSFLESLTPTNFGFPFDTNKFYSILKAGTFFDKENSPLTLELRAIQNNNVVGKSIFRMMRTCCDFRVIEGNMNIKTDL